MQFVYKVYDGKRLICEGPVVYIQRKLNFKQDTLRKHAVSGALLKNRYKIIREKIGHISDVELYESIKTHIMIYGNTVCKKKPYDIIDQLKNEGIYCLAEKKTDRKKEEYYILRRCDA